MSDKMLNDNDAGRAALRGPDAHGQAALLLVESLLHGLIARSIISVEDAVEITEVAAEVKEQVAADLGDSPATMQKSLTLLQSISLSLKSDTPDG